MEADMRTVWIFVFTSLTVGIALAQSQPRKMGVSQILAEKDLWGKDFGQALVRVQSLNEIGQKEATIFEVNQVVGGTTYSTRTEAEAASAKLTTAGTTARQNVDQALRHLWKTSSVSVGERSTNVEIVSQSGGDQVATKSSKPAQFLAPGTTISTIEQKLGPPEKVSQQLIQTEYERRPVVLTLYAYGDGAIKFAESDMEPKGKIDRVIVDTSKIATSINEAIH
jgi:hypothetical protein